MTEPAACWPIPTCRPAAAWSSTTACRSMDGLELIGVLRGRGIAAAGHPDHRRGPTRSCVPQAEKLGVRPRAREAAVGRRAARRRSVRRSASAGARVAGPPCRAPSWATCWPFTGVHQAGLALLSVAVFVLSAVPLELQRRIVNGLIDQDRFRDHLLAGAGLCRRGARRADAQAVAQCLSRMGRREHGPSPARRRLATSRRAACAIRPRARAWRSP